MEYEYDLMLIAMYYAAQIFQLNHYHLSRIFWILDLGSWILNITFVMILHSTFSTLYTVFCTRKCVNVCYMYEKTNKKFEMVDAGISNVMMEEI